MSYREALKAYENLSNGYSYTNKMLGVLRREISEILNESPERDRVTVVAVGSFGRMEASESSDLDLYILFDSDRNPNDIIPNELDKLQQCINKHVPKQAGDTGTFGPNAYIRFSDLLSNIGGTGDSNELMTRRLLFLLEGTWLYGETRFKEYRRELLGKYVNDDDGDYTLPKFLLNDIIRYYRTITTDFEHKVTDGNKSWGLRQVKLRFSRKILYFGGIIAVAEAAGATRKNRLDELEKWFDIPGLERLYSAAQAGELEELATHVLELYEVFLAAISDPAQRETLDALDRDNRRACCVYMSLRGKATELSECLDRWLKAAYKEDHQIHHALLF